MLKLSCNLHACSKRDAKLRQPCLHVRTASSTGAIDPILVEADILVSVHFHHYRNRCAGRRRTRLQIPALDGGSAWYSVKKGEDQSAGMISVWLEPGTETGWSGLTIHS